MNVHNMAAASGSQRSLTVIEEKPPVFSSWASRACWLLSLLTLFASMVSRGNLDLQLYRAGSAVERLEVLQDHNTGVTLGVIAAAAFSVMALLFAIRAQLVGLARSLNERTDGTTDELLTSIRDELRWQRQQKEKELHRAKAAATKHAGNG